MSYPRFLDVWLRDWLCSDEPDGGWQFIAGHGCGWTDGGCGVLGDALVDWLGEDWATLAVLKDRGGPQHVVVQVGNWYLDGDGVSTRSGLLRRWITQEGLREPLAIEPVEEVPFDWDDPPLSRRLADELRRRMYPRDALAALGVP